MSSYDPIEELSSSPYPEMSMSAVTSPLLAHSIPQPYLQRLNGHSWDFRKIVGSGGWNYTYEDILSSNYTGALFEDFKKDFYERVHFMPGQINLGNVLSVQTEEIIVWNAHFSSKDITNYQEPVAQGVTVQEPVSPPYSMAPLEELSYIVTVSVDGPPQFSEQILWTIDGVEYSVPVTGQRVVVWPFGPNWDQPMVESLEWKTDVTTTFDGTEQRRQLRSKPRKKLGYRLTLDSNELNQFQNLLFGWQDRQYALPVWQDKSVLQNQLNAGMTTIPVQTATRSFSKNGLAILMTDTYTFEVFEVDQVNSDHIIAKKPMEATWGINAQLYPVNLAILPTSIPTQRLTSRVMACQVEFLANPVRTDPSIPDDPAVETLNGHEVIYRKPNWSTPVGYDMQSDVDVLDYQTGGVQQIQRSSPPRQTRRVSWLLRNRDDIREFRAMLGRRKGQLIPAYIPTWFNDFEVNDISASGSSALRVKRSQYDAMVGVADVQKHVLIRLRDGTSLIREIVGTSKSDADTEVLNLDAALPAEVNQGNTLMVSLVHLCRLLQDGVTINYQSDSVATVEMTMTTVKA